MSWHSLPIDRHKVEVPKENCYIVIHRFGDDYLKPKDKKLTKQEINERKENLLKQENTIRQLETGYCNLYNNKIQLDTIFDSCFVTDLEDDNAIIYRIEPLTSNSESKSYNNSQKNYFTSEFNVIKKLCSKEEILAQIYKDKLMSKFITIIFDSLSYGNEGYNLKLYSYYEYINKTYPDIEISLSDIILDLENYNRPIRNHFGRKDTYDITRQNIRYLLEHKLIQYIKEEDYYTTNLIIALIESELFDIAFNCVKLLNEYNRENLIKSKDFDLLLRKWSTNEYVKEIIGYLNITLSGVTLIVKSESEYGEDRIIQTKMFNNIAEVKTYLIKEYDIPFEKIVNEDLTEFWYDEMTFTVN